MKRKEANEILDNAEAATLEALSKCDTDDVVEDHSKADMALVNLLREIGFDDVADVYQAIRKCYW